MNEPLKINCHIVIEQFEAFNDCVKALVSIDRFAVVVDEATCSDDETGGAAAGATMTRTAECVTKCTFHDDITYVCATHDVDRECRNWISVATTRHLERRGCALFLLTHLCTRALRFGEARARRKSRKRLARLVGYAWACNCIIFCQAFKFLLARMSILVDQSERRGWSRGEEICIEENGVHRVEMILQFNNWRWQERREDASYKLLGVISRSLLCAWNRDKRAISKGLRKYMPDGKYVNHEYQIEMRRKSIRHTQECELDFFGSIFDVSVVSMKIMMLHCMRIHTCVAQGYWNSPRNWRFNYEISREKTGFNIRCHWCRSSVACADVMPDTLFFLADCVFAYLPGEMQFPACAWHFYAPGYP